MTKLRVLLVDDEPLARLRMRGLIEAIDETHGEVRAEVVAEAATTSQATQWLREHGCDVVLLDVQMPGPDGLQLADSLRQKPHPPLVIFVTAHAMHAVEAFELEALDYLTKPVRRERLHAAFLRAQQRLAERAAASTQGETTDAGALSPVDVEFLTLSERGRVLRVPLSEVLYFKAELKYVTVRTANETHVLDGSLADLETRYPNRFLRIHRNALVARSAVRELERHAPTGSTTAFGELDGDAGRDFDAGDNWAVRVAHVDEWLTVSRRQVSAVREALAGQ